MENYLNLLEDVLENGEFRDDRTGTGTISVFNRQLRFDLQKGFPIVTTKKVHWKSIAHELLWFISGNSNIKYLKENNVRIWNEWADENGDLGPVYGVQWRNWLSNQGVQVDQLKETIDSIKNNPKSRRHIVSAWNAGEIPNMALPPCHMFFQFYVTNDNKLSLSFYMRSSDIFLGLPFNIASYALLCHLVASVCNLEVGELVYTGCDVHLYKNHLEQAKTQLKRDPKPLPSLVIVNPKNNIDDYTFDDFELKDYNHHPLIKGKVSV